MGQLRNPNAVYGTSLHRNSALVRVSRTPVAAQTGTWSIAVTVTRR